MPRASLLLSVGVLTAVALLLLLPTPYRRALTVGTDSYETHRPLFGTTTLTQPLTPTRPVTGVGVLAVDLRRANQLTPLQVVATDAAGVERARAEIAPAAIADDALAWASFSSGSLTAGEPVTLSLTAPMASARTAYGIRFDAESGHLAVGVIESIPAYEQLLRWQTAHPAAAQALRAMLVTATALILLQHVATRYHVNRLRWFGLGLLVLAVATVALRLPTAAQVDSLFGGDALNYVMKSRAWVEGHDPFATDPRKAPLLSLLLLPGLRLVDPLALGRAIGMLSASAGVILVALIARRLGLPPLLALASGALLAVNRLWWWESVHGLANIPYATLLLAAILAFLALKPYAVGVLLGLATLTRYEGVLAAATLLPALWLNHPRWRTVARSVLPAAVLLAVPFVLWPLTGNLGVRTSSDILDDPGLYIAWDWGDFLSNADRLRLMIGRLWLLQELVGNQGAALTSGIVGGLVVAGLAHRFTPLRAGGYSLMYLSSAGLIGVVVTANSELLKGVGLAITTLTGVGLGYAVVRRPRQVLPLVLMVIVQVLLTTALLPKERYYIVIIPGAVLAIAAGLHALGARRPAADSFGPLLALGLLIGLAYANTRAALPGLISDYNDKSAPATTLTRVAAYFRAHPGRVGAPRYAELFMRSYVPTHTFILLNTTDSPEPAEELATLRRESVEFVFTVAGEAAPSSLTTYPEQFIPVTNIADATIYRLQPEHDPSP